MIAAVVASIALPLGGSWTNVTPSHGSLVVWGPSDRGPGCSFVTVDPRSLRSSSTRGDCSRLVRLRPRVVWNGRTTWAQVRVAGRLALTYRDSSTGRPQWACGGGSLWLYDVDTPTGAQLLRYSLRTHRLQQRLRFPVRLFRPVLAANDDGAWLMAATNGGVSGQPAAALYHVTTRVRVVQRGARAALWMAARGRTLWLETVTGTQTFRLWRYDGARGRPLWTRHGPLTYGMTFGAGSLWGVSAGCSRRVRAFRVDARTGAWRTIATVPLVDCTQDGANAYFRGAFWFVDGNRLFRVR